MTKYGIVFTSAFIFSVVFTFLLLKLSQKSRILKTGVIPSIGGPAAGLAFIIALSLAVYVFGLTFGKISAIAGLSLIMLIMGIIDDLKESSVIQKFLVQSVCAVLLIISGVRTEIMFFGFWPNAIITFVWIVGVTNAFNLLDIMDGLAAGITAIISLAFLILGFMNSDLVVQAFSLILCGISAGFLIFNMPPARAYLGNSGSHFFGLLVASLALITHYASGNNTFALLSPMMIVGLPVIDTLSLIFFRLIKKRPPFNKSKDHIALKIGALGFSPLKTILIMYFLGMVFTACGVSLSCVSNLAAAVIIFLIFLFSISIFLKLLKIETNV